jgi:Fe-Mn family superoxide dismutase
MEGEHLAPESGPAGSGDREPRPLPFDPARLRGLSESLILRHWAEVYCGDVRALNDVERRLAAIIREPRALAHVHDDLRREELLRRGSIRLHELYFGNLGGDGIPGGKMRHVLADAFGSFLLWEYDFRRLSLALAERPGWTILAAARDGSLHNYWGWENAGDAPGAQPLLVLDMSPHAYELDYGTDAVRYIDAFLQNVDWEQVARRFADGPPDPDEEEPWE